MCPEKMALEDKNQQQQKTDTIKTSQSLCQSISMLPKETVVEILLRLPFDSLLQCRSVCKLWCSLISDPHFVKSHLSLSTSTSNDNCAHPRVLFSTYPRRIFKTCHLYDMLYDNSINALELDNPLKNACIVGSCNGLLCIASKGAVFIWNPSTGKSNRLPNDDHREMSDWGVMYGFGYDKCTDDYKVVEASGLFKEIVMYETFVKIYSLKNGIWKKIGSPPKGVPMSVSGLFFNGIVHWVVRTGWGPTELLFIISLDLAKETYGEVSQPIYDEGYNKSLTLGALREWLCISCDYRGRHVDLWVRKVYGVQDSWTKLVSIEYNDVKCCRWSSFSVPLWIVNDGKILLTFGYKVIVYDTKNSSYSEIQDICKCDEACTYVESLVSPHSPNTIDD